MLPSSGYVHLRSILSKSSVEKFVEQIRSELAEEGQSERCVGKLSLTDATTWPKKGSRRVVECAPEGVGNH